MFEVADATELQRLTPAFRVVVNRTLFDCDPTKQSTPTTVQTLGYYVTRTATACAQACNAWNSEVAPDGSNGTVCNVAEFHTDLNVGGDVQDFAALINSTGSSTTYSAWNCWLKVINDTCGLAPPAASLPQPGASLLVMEVTDRPRCAPIYSR